MAVSQETQIPNQPAGGGSLSYRALGGNGFDAPQSMYMVNAALVEADVSGGLLAQTWIMDPQYECLIQSVTVSIASVADAPVCTFELRNPLTSPTSVFAIATLPIAQTTARVTWVPSPMFGVEVVAVSLDNVDTEDLFVSMTIFNYRKRASELVPLNILLSSLPRAASMI